MNISLDTTDLNRLQKLTAGLTLKTQKKSISAGMRAALNIIKNRAKSNLRSSYKGYQTGNLESSIKVKLSSRGLGMRVGEDRSISHISHLVDLGTKKRTTKSGANRGEMPITSYWTDAFKSSESEVKDKMFSAIQRSIDRIIKKGGE